MVPDQYNLILRLKTPLCHEKNVIEPKYGVITSVFLHMWHADSHFSASWYAVQSVQTSEELNYNNIELPYEFLKSYPGPLLSSNGIALIC